MFVFRIFQGNKMGKIAGSIDIFIKKLRDKHLNVIFLDSFVPYEQKGQTCKLVAGLAVQNYLSVNKFNSLSPFPLYKENKTFDYSIRQRAKEIIQSKVGEVFGSEQVKKVFEYGGFQVDSFRLQDENSYTSLVWASLKNACPVIAYFDVVPKREDIPDRGAPSRLQGEFEHAAVLVGIYQEKHEYHIIYVQWGQYFECSASDLFLSSAQLKANKPQEHYRKLQIPFLIPEPSWFSDEQVHATIDGFYQDSLIKSMTYPSVHSLFSSDDPAKNRVATPPAGLQGSLAYTMTVITGDRMKKEFLKGYQPFLISEDKSELIENSRISPGN